MKKKKVQEYLPAMFYLENFTKCSELIKYLQSIQDKYKDQYSEITINYDEDKNSWLTGARIETDNEFEARKKMVERAKKKTKKRVQKQKVDKEKRDLKLLAKLQKQYPDHKE